MNELALLLAFQLLASVPPSSPPAKPREKPQVTGEKVATGIYRFAGSAEIGAEVAPLLAIVTAYDEQCRRGCRYTVPSVDRTEILPGERPGLFYTWSYIDDLLDGSYFAAVESTSEGKRRSVHFFTPDTPTLARLADKKHPHDPFFDFQEGTWTFEELPVAEGETPRTRVQVHIEMRSKSFLVNLMPGQILERTKKHLELIYQYLGDAATPEARQE